MVTWLNTNSGAVMVLLTAVYVICTIVLCLVAYHSNKTTLQLHLDVQRPVVVCDIFTLHTLVYFRIRNLGPQSARNVKISVKEEPPFSEMWAQNSAITKGITFFAPGQEIVTFYQAPGKFKPVEITFIIRYQDASGRNFNDTYLYDLAAFGFEDIGRENNDPLVQAARKIAEELKALKGCLSNR